MANGRRRTKLTRALATWEESLPDAYLQCRDLGHLWRPFTAQWHQQERAYSRVLSCQRCGTQRAQWVSASGHIAHGNAYTYPEGYTAPAGSGRMDGVARDALRLASVLRMVDQLGDHETERKRA
jgi:hypothetical protein